MGAGQSQNTEFSSILSQQPETPPVISPLLKPTTMASSSSSSSSDTPTVLKERLYGPKDVKAKFVNEQTGFEIATTPTGSIRESRSNELSPDPDDLNSNKGDNLNDQASQQSESQAQNLENEDEDDEEDAIMPRMTARKSVILAKAQGKSGKGGKGGKTIGGKGGKTKGKTGRKGGFQRKNPNVVKAKDATGGKAPRLNLAAKTGQKYPKTTGKVKRRYRYKAGSGLLQ
jgi:hypothetical protein